MTLHRSRRRPAGRLAVVVGFCLAASATTLAAQSPPAPVPAEGEAAAKDVMTIRDAVAIALERNRDLAAARYALEEANGRVREAWGSVFPSVDLSTSYTRNLTVPSSFLPAIFIDPNAGPDELIPVRFGSDNLWSLSVQFNQPIFEAQAFIGVGAAGRYKNLQDEVVRGTAQGVATRARVAYHDVLLAKERVRLSEKTLDRIRRTLEETRAMQEAGLASEYDVLRLEVQLGNLEPELRRARNAHAEARRTLAVELGLEPTDTIEIAGSLLDIELEQVTDGESATDDPVRFAGLHNPTAMPVERIVEMAMDGRSDLRQLRLTRELRTAELRVAQVEYLPRVSLFGTYSINTQENGDLDFFGGAETPRAYGRQIGLRVTLPLFSGLKRPARVGQRRAAVQQVRVQHGRARAQAESEVRTFLERLDETRQRAEAQRRAVEQARRGYEIASVRFREGVGSRLEVTDAEVALRQSEFNYAQAVYEYLAARARLDRAVGMVPMVDTEAETRFDTPIRTTQ